MIENPHDGGIVTLGLGDGEGLVCQQLTSFERTSVGKLRTECGEHERPISIVGGKPVESKLQYLDFVGVDDTGGAEPASVVGQGGGHESLRVVEIGSPARSPDEGVAKRGVPRLALGGSQPDGKVEREDRVRVGGLGVEVEGLGVVTQCIGGGEGTERGVARQARVADGLGEVDGLGGIDPVARQLARPLSGAIAAEAF